MSGVLTMTRARYRYPSASDWAIELDLTVAAGELVLLSGPTGCGKSTALRLAAGLLGRHGDGVIAGEITVAGADPAALEPSDRAARIGFVSQTPERQVLTASLGDEIAFPLQCLGWAPQPIAARVHEQLAAFGLPPDPARSTDALSGGQRQRLVTASAMAGGAELLLLDEPLAQLDPDGARELMHRLRALADAGTAVLIVEHRLGPTLPHVDRVLLMERGGVVANCAPDALEPDTLTRLGMRLPPEPGASPAEPPQPTNPPGLVLIETGPLRFRHEGADVDALAMDGVTLRAGERVALLGPNGSGKSTLIAALAGDIDAGAVQRHGRLLDLPQDPDLTLFAATVRDELEHGPREQRVDPAEIAQRAQAAADALTVNHLMPRAPHSLSRGQRLRVAVGAVLACNPDIVLLDEPTSGQDHAHVERMMLELRSPDRALLFATHDEDLARRHATRIVRLAPSGPPAAPPPRELPPPHGLDARVRLALLLCVGVLAVVLSSPVALGLLALAAAASLVAVGIPRRWLLRGGLALLAVVWSTVLSQGLFYAELPRVPLLTLGPVIIWQQGVEWGLVQSMRFVATLLAGIAVAVSTPADRIHAALLRLRVPFGLAFLSSMALRSVPETARSALIVRRARARRGRPLWARSPWAWLRLEVELLRPVVAEALRRARSLAEALDARGFDPAGPSSTAPSLALPAPQSTLLLAASAVTLAAASARMLFVLYGAEVLYLPALRPLYGFVRSWL